MFKFVAFAVLLVFLFLLYLEFFQKQKEVVKVQRFTDTLIVRDTIQIQVVKYVKVEVRKDTSIRKFVDSLIKLQKDSLQNLLEFVLCPVDTTFYFDPKGSVRINFQPINRYLFTEVVLPKIIERTTIKDSIIVEVQKNDYKELAIAGAVGFVVGVLLLVIH